MGKHVNPLGKKSRCSRRGDMFRGKPKVKHAIVEKPTRVISVKPKPAAKKAAPKKK